MPKAKDKTKRRRVEELEVCMKVTRLHYLNHSIKEMQNVIFFFCRMTDQVSLNDLAEGRVSKFHLMMK